MTPHKSLVGQRFGRGLVLSEAGKKHNRYCYELICDCGNKYITNGDNLRNGGTKSCGCLKRESAKKNYNPRTQPPGVSSFNNLFKHYKIEANKRNLPFELSEDEFRSITQENCYYCGCEPSTVFHRFGGNGAYVYNGIDRVNNSLGYVAGNIVACCKTCNFAKHDMVFAEFVKWVSRTHHHMKQHPELFPE